MMSRSVLFPAPFTPIRTRNSPPSAEKVRESSTGCPGYPYDTLLTASKLLMAEASLESSRPRPPLADPASPNTPTSTERSSHFVPPSAHRETARAVGGAPLAHRHFPSTISPGSRRDSAAPRSRAKCADKRWKSRSAHWHRPRSRATPRDTPQVQRQRD